jgi:hypothetical protein
MSTAPHSQLPYPLTIPPNNVPPPLPADPLIFQLADSQHAQMLNALSFLWDGYVMGAEDLHPIIITSPFGMRFDPRSTSGVNFDMASFMTRL